MLFLVVAASICFLFLKQSRIKSSIGVVAIRSVFFGYIIPSPRQWTKESAQIPTAYIGSWTQWLGKNLLGVAASGTTSPKFQTEFSTISVLLYSFSAHLSRTPSATGTKNFSSLSRSWLGPTGQRISVNPTHFHHFRHWFMSIKK